MKADIRDAGLIPGSRRSPGVGNGNQVRYFCLESSMNRDAGQATAHGIAESDTTEHKPLILVTLVMALFS